MAPLNFVMYGINFVLCLIGGTMLGVGIWMAVDTDAFDAFAGVDEDLYWSSVYIMITIGALVLIVSLLGFVGAVSPSKNKWALFGFIGVLCLVLILELILIIITGVFWDSLDVGTQEQMTDDVKYKYVSETANDSVSVAWNDMQVEWRCCGSRDYKDYQGSLYTNTYHETVPWTCCVMDGYGRDFVNVVNEVQCRIDAGDNDILNPSQFLHNRGCYSVTKDFLVDHSIILIALTVAFAALEVFGLVIAVMLLRGD